MAEREITGADSIFGISLGEPAEVWTEVDLEAAAEPEAGG